MTETELKFQVPPQALHAVRSAVGTASASTTRLRARYLDTPDGRLARAGLSLRLRLEGRQWVQTLKGAPSGLAGRPEHEVPLRPVRGVPVAAPGLHAGTAIGQRLLAVLGDTGAASLQTVFETDVRRVNRIVRVAGAQIELALDLGHIHAAGRSLPLCELEFELLRGPLQALIDLARRWVQRHGLWLDVRTKAERGLGLAQGVDARPAAGYQAPVLRDDMPDDAARRVMVGAALAQVLPNVAVLAGGVGGPEHLHQARVGLRRLRSVLRLFDSEGGLPDPTWTDALAGLFRRLGGARDADVLVQTLWPAIQAAGGPRPTPIDSGRAGAQDVGAVLRERGTTDLLLRLLCDAESPPSAEGPPIRAPAAATLLRLHRRLSRAARDLKALDDAQRHRLRRHLKRLRYGVEATASLWPDKPCRRYLSRLRQLQDALGACTDLHMAADALAAALPADDAVWFARGWVAARQAQMLDHAAEVLADWPVAPKAWRTA